MNDTPSIKRNLTARFDELVSKPYTGNRPVNTITAQDAQEARDRRDPPPQEGILGADHAEPPAERRKRTRKAAAGRAAAEPKDDALFLGMRMPRDMRDAMIQSSARVERTPSWVVRRLMERWLALPEDKREDALRGK